MLHQRDLEFGAGDVCWLEALSRLSPDAAKRFCWQWVFPSTRRRTDPSSGEARRNHVSEDFPQKYFA
ncbi:MAG: integron integrase, partial [Planctomycetota bacterium]